MNESRILWIAFGISTLAHGGLFMSLGERPEFQIGHKTPTIEVTYIRPLENLSIKDLPKPQDLPKASTKKIDLPEPPLKLPEYQPLSVPPQKPVTPPMAQISFDKKITLLEELEKNLDYQQYYSAVRERIRFYAEKNYKSFESLGVVHLAFALQQNGALKGIQVFREGTSANEFLIQVAIRSVKEAAPFPSFPHTIEHPELPFSILIEFKKE